MSLYEYEKSKAHPSAVCIRVVVSVGGEYRQKYFPSDEKEKALKWEAAQIKARDAYNRKLARTRSRHAQNGFWYTETGVKGLRIRVKKPSGRETGYRLSVCVNIQSTLTGNRANRQVVVTKHTLSKQWYNQCVYLAYHLGRSTPPKAWLDLCPVADDFKVLLKEHKKDNPLLDIPLIELPKFSYPKVVNKKLNNVIRGY